MANIEKLIGSESSLEVGQKINEIIENKANKNLNNTGMLTNCLLEVPQNIKLELNNGTLTLKKGSKIIVPNGVGVFEEVIINSDLTYGLVYTTSVDCYAVYDATLNSIQILSLTDSNLSFDTTNNKVVHQSLTNQKLSFPFALVNRNTTGISKIYQIFNCMGYIKNTIWVDKGVKVLIPNGRNKDGSLNNIEKILDKVCVYTHTSAAADAIFVLTPTSINNGSAYNVAASGYAYSEDEPTTVRWYKPSANMFYLKKDNGWNEDKQVHIGFTTKTADRFTSLKPKQPFRAIDYSDKQLVTRWSFPDWSRWTGKAGNTTYTAETDGWLIAKGRTSQQSCGLIINNQYVSYAEAAGSNDSGGFACLVPVVRGQTYKLEGSGSKVALDVFAFMPCIGG